MNLSELIEIERNINSHKFDKNNDSDKSPNSVSADRSDGNPHDKNSVGSNLNPTKYRSYDRSPSETKDFEPSKHTSLKVDKKSHSYKSSNRKSDSQDEDNDTKIKRRSRSKDYKRKSNSTTKQSKRNHENSRNRERVRRSSSNHNRRRRNESHESNKRERNRSRDRNYRERPRNRDRNREITRYKSRDRNREITRYKSRDRSSSRNRRDRPRRRRDSSNESRRRNRNNSYSRRNRSDSRSKYYAADVKEIQKKLTDEEKDARTVNVWQLSNRVRTRDLEDLFSSIGKLCVVRLILDPRSGKSRGVAYIQFRNTDSVDKALGLNGTKLQGVPIQIRTVSSEKCRAAEASMGGGGINMKGPTKLCISNLHEIITDKNLEEIFSPYGQITEIKLLNDINGRSSGTAFLTFLKGENARTAMDQLNEFMLAQKPMKISPVTESNFGSELNESQGISMSASDRLGLMAKLAVGTSLQIAPSVRNDDSVVISSQCVVLSNMFDVAEAQDDEFCQEIEEDIISECSKFGGVLHVHVDRKSRGGYVYMKCPTVPIASQCANSLNGRSFDGRVVTASYVPLSNYTDIFPESAKLTKKLRC